MQSTWDITDDLSTFGVGLAFVFAVASILLLLREQRVAERREVSVLVSGVVASVVLLGALLRPVQVQESSAELGARIVALVDGSRRLGLPAGGGKTRLALAEDAVRRLGSRYGSARLSVLEFAEDGVHPYRRGASHGQIESDLETAVSGLFDGEDERPAAIVVLSDGRLTRPSNLDAAASWFERSSQEGVKIHTVGLVEQDPPDASIRAVRAAGAAVAHQPLALTVEVGCSGGLACGDVPVRIAELLSGEPPARLATGAVRVVDGTGLAEFEITLDRAGTRVLEISIDSPEGDAVPENDTRLITFSVTKERVRLLHLAGRPTYDVRALRTWLKSDDSVDVVAFFILRGETDDPVAGEGDLALIRFPVDELFTEHLPSFDAVILQDIDAIKYRLSRYLVGLERYVKEGGGLIMVGGPSSFGGGQYAGTPLDSILPVEQPRGDETVDPAAFVPVFTEAGRVAPVTQKLRSLLGGELPEMSGANLLGAARPGAIVLWEHPRLTVAGRGMPLLALGEAGDGRAIAMGVDATYSLAFGGLAARASGRAYGALWDGLLGWLMRDPRYEAARVELTSDCVAGESAMLRVHRLPGMVGDLTLSVESLMPKPEVVAQLSLPSDGRPTTEVQLPALAAGGYSVRVVVGASPATRHDFGCEAGGRAWADSRANNELLAEIARLGGGRHVMAPDLDELPQAPTTRVTASRRASPWLPAWLWALLASVALGVHWLMRRQAGLT